MRNLLLKSLCLVIICSFGLLAGCSAKQTDSAEDASTQEVKPALVASSQFDEQDLSENLEFEPLLIPDPLYHWNYFWFSFNDYVLNYVFRPIHTGYDFITPDPVQVSIGNFFNNLMFPVRFVNSLLQFKFEQAGVEMSRFVLNTTYGVGGLFNPAAGKKARVQTDSEDFGQTLGRWGIGEGFYLVLPIFGPSNSRDLVGRVGDYFLDPLNYVSPWGLEYGAKGTKAINDSGSTIRQYDRVKDMAVDPYASIRNAYTQYRRNKVSK